MLCNTSNKIEFSSELYGSNFIYVHFQNTIFLELVPSMNMLTSYRQSYLFEKIK